MGHNLQVQAKARKVSISYKGEYNKLSDLFKLIIDLMEVYYNMEYNNQSGMAFSMTNNIDNSIVAFGRNYQGLLFCLGVYMTNGNGTGEQIVDPLGSQGSVILSHDGRFLFAVNAGNNSISSFYVCHNKLMLVDVVPSRGIFPNSLATFGNLLYVTNAGDSTSHSNVTGFCIEADGHLRNICGSTTSLSSANAQPGCIVFDNCGKKLIVSEKATNNLSVFQVKSNGTLIGPIVNQSNGNVPFGTAALGNGTLLVTEAGPNAMSSYTVATDGTLNVINGSVLNYQSATCWVSADPREQHAYTSNAGSGTITNYSINHGGRLTVIESIPSIPQGTGAPIDSGIDRSGRNFYVLNGNKGSISVFEIENNGNLVLMNVCIDTNLPQIGAQGLAIL
jgi:6-phosphogluconolactonase (cycloisomerase 2 family)